MSKVGTPPPTIPRPEIPPKPEPDEPDYKSDKGFRPLPASFCPTAAAREYSKAECPDSLLPAAERPAELGVPSFRPRCIPDTVSDDRVSTYIQTFSKLVSLPYFTYHITPMLLDLDMCLSSVKASEAIVAGDETTPNTVLKAKEIKDEIQAIRKELQDYHNNIYDAPNAKMRRDELLRRMNALVPKLALFSRTSADRLKSMIPKTAQLPYVFEGFEGKAQRKDYAQVARLVRHPREKQEATNV